MRVVYEDAELLILDKPSGAPTHALASTSPNETLSAVDFALRISPDLPANPEHPRQNGLCHRLDTGTSGLLVFAKSPELLHRARAHWSEFAEIKTYQAIVRAQDFFDGKIPREISFPVGHSKKSSKRMIAIRHAGHLAQIRGKPLNCKTEITASAALPKNHYALTLNLHGGVMHQIRCHLAEIGLSIVGDTIYGAKGDKKAEGESRLMLHHACIVIRPAPDFTLSVSSELPPEFKRFNVNS